MPPIYLDSNATTPIAPEVAGAMQPYLGQIFGNPSSSHFFGRRVKAAVVKAREQVAALLGVASDEVIFTSGGSEANNMALRGLSAEATRRQIIISAVEHPAITEVCDALAAEGMEILVLPVDGDGLVDPADLQRIISHRTLLVSVMLANNEVGSIQPVAELAEIARAHGALMHTDAAQAVGKIPVDVMRLGVDMLSLAGHKFYAPAGVGALIVRRGVELKRLIHGADHESGRRAGTENVLEIVGLGAAAELAAAELPSRAEHMRRMRDRLEAGLRAGLGDLHLNGHPDRRLPNTSSVSFPRVEANTLLDELADELAASAGAACHTDSVDISAVLRAMSVPEEIAMGTVRLSTGRHTSEVEIDSAVALLLAAVRRLRPEASVKARDKSDGPLRLTRFTHGLGCACKLRPQDLERVLADLPSSKDPRVLVGLETADDATVYRLSEDLAIVETVDFFTPVVDDPYDFGAIAAANALSDVYAMGAEPLFALSIVAFPDRRLPLDVLKSILAGAWDKVAEAGVSILGGHSIEDPEPKFGLAVTGRVHPEKIWRNRGGVDGDVLILTKPLGTGVLATAMKRSMLEAERAREAIELMAQLNRAPAEALAGLEVHACTDVSGFGLLGHLKEMVQGGELGVRLGLAQIPLLGGLRELMAQDLIPGGTRSNHAFVAECVDYDAEIAPDDQLLLCDAQTSGGLLLALGRADAEVFLDRLGDSRAAVIGEFGTKAAGRIRVTAKI